MNSKQRRAAKRARAELRGTYPPGVYCQQLGRERRPTHWAMLPQPAPWHRRAVFLLTFGVWGAWTVYRNGRIQP